MKKDLAVIVAVVALAGCTSSEERKAQEAAQQAAASAQQAAAGAQQAAAGAQQAAQSAQQGAQSAQQGAQQFAQGMQQLAQGLQSMAAAQGDVVPFESLTALLPETLGGWTRERAARGEQVSMPIKVSNAKGEYRKGDSTLEVDITDATLNQLILAPLSMFLVSGYEERSDSGYKKYAPVGTMPGFESWEKNDKRAEVTLVVNKRFIVQATGHNVDSVDSVRSAIQALDVTKLATLK